MLGNTATRVLNAVKSAGLMGIATRAHVVHAQPVNPNKRTVTWLRICFVLGVGCFWFIPTHHQTPDGSPLELPVVENAI
jgi:hypothetical protein